MLTLPIMGKWFDMILSGEKSEEWGAEPGKRILYPQNTSDYGKEKLLICSRRYL